MKYAIVENNVIVNIINADTQWIEQSGLNFLPYIGGSIGDIYENGNITEASPAPITNIDDLPEVQKIGLVKSLRHFNMLQGILTIITNSDIEVQDAWNFKNTFKANHPLLLKVAADANISDETIIQVFLKAKELETI